MYLCVESNGTRSITDHPGSSGWATWIAFIVALGNSSAAATAASAVSTRPSPPAGAAPVSSSTFSSVIAPVVSVPVLSEASTVTRARLSTACSRWTSTCLRPSRITATVWAMLSRSTNPCGTSATTPATTPSRVVCTDSSSLARWPK